MPDLGHHLDYNFRLEIRPFSVNSYHFRDKRHKTPEAKSWEEAVLTQLLNEAKELSAMADDWRKSGGYFELHLHAFYPHRIFYTAEGELSGRTIDITNFEKPLQDLIFGQACMGLNDKLVKKLVSEKSPGTHNYIEVMVRLVQS